MSISINKKYSFEISINSPTILVRNHSQLDQLDYESSGHTGFASSDEFSSHVENTNNPHSVTKTQVGLENVEDGAQINIIEKVNIDGTDLTPLFTKEIPLLKSPPLVTPPCPKTFNLPPCAAIFCKANLDLLLSIFPI